MIRLILLTVAILMAGCNSTDSGPGPKLDGTYQHTIVASDGTVVMQWIFSSGNTFEGKVYEALNDGSVDCLVSEANGNWAPASDAIKLEGTKARSRAKCDSAFSAWEERPAKSDPIRNLTSSGFELYIAANEDSPAEWLKFSKL